MNAAAMFSGGKESAYAIYLVQKQGVRVEHLIYAIPSFVSPHAHNIEAVKALAESMGKHFTVTNLDMDGDELVATLKSLNVNALVAGDINVPEHITWLNGVCARASGVKLLEPLFGKDTLALFREMFLENANGRLKATIIGVDSRRLSEEWLGFTLSKDTAESFLSRTRGIDPLGENGEYHTICIESPLYSKAFKAKTEEKNSDKNMVFLRVRLLQEEIRQG